MRQARSIPWGLKGAGEGGANAVGAAVAAAIDDALGVPNAVTELPITPQRLRRLDTAGDGESKSLGESGPAGPFEQVPVVNSDRSTVRFVQLVRRSHLWT